MAHDVFISQSAKDKAIGDAICSFLESRKIRCWIAPRDIPPGLTWGKAIVNAISESRLMVLVFSSHSNRSQQVSREVERAVSKGIPILPLRIEDVSPSEDMEYFLSTTHWLDALSPPLEQHLNQLVDSVDFLLSRSAAADSQPSNSAGTCNPNQPVKAVVRSPLARKPVASISRRTWQMIAILTLAAATTYLVTQAPWFNASKSSANTTDAAAVQADWDFEYGFKSLNEEQADDHIVRTHNTKAYAEHSPPLTYWGPSTSNTDASLIFCFEFPSHTTGLFLRANLTTFNLDMNGIPARGECSLWATKDGTNWMLLLDNPSPTNATSSTKTYNQELPEELLGTTNIWIQVRMRTYGVSSSYYSAAQFCRSGAGSINDIFEVKARFTRP